MRVPATGAAGAAVVVIVFGLLLSRPAFLADLDSRLYDSLTACAGPGKQSGKVAIVEIDEASLKSFGRWPWPRDLVDRLLRRILENGAAAVVVDIMFPEADRGHDEAFAGTLRGKPVVIGY